MSTDTPSHPAPPAAIHLRRTLHSDVPALFDIQLDSAGSQLAGTKPRDRAAFEARWNEILAPAPDHPASLISPTGVTPRVIIADGVLVGSINITPQDGFDWIGYWLAREHWGRGIATRAIALLLAEYAARPLYARVVTYNVASLRALERNGFTVVSRRHVPADDRCIAADRIILMLAAVRSPASD